MVRIREQNEKIKQRREVWLHLQMCHVPFGLFHPVGRQKGRRRIQKDAGGRADKAGKGQKGPGECQQNT